MKFRAKIPFYSEHYCLPKNSSLFEFYKNVRDAGNNSLLRSRRQARVTAAAPTTFNNPFTSKIKIIMLVVNDC